MGAVLIVGGGITGLAAAHELIGAGVPVILAEASGRLGGKIRTEHIDGFLVEAGPDSFVSYRPGAAQLAREVGLGDQIISTTDPRIVSLRRNGAMIAMPDGMGLVLPTKITPFARTKLFSWPQKLRAGLDVVLPRRLGPDDVSIGEFLRHRLGDAMVDQLGDPLLGGVYGTSIDELSLDAVLPMLREYETAHRSLLVASLASGRQARARAKTGNNPGSPFRSLAAGMGSLSAAVAAELEASADADVRLGVSVTRLERVGGRTTAYLSDGAVLHPDAVILAAPASVAAGLLEATAPSACAPIRSVRHGSTAVVSLGYEEEAFVEPVRGHGFLEAGPQKAAFSACTFSSRKWAGRAPQGTVLIRAFLPDRSHGLAARPDQEVFDVVAGQVGAVLHATAKPIMSHIARWDDAMPKYTVGHLDRIAVAEAAMADVPDWFLAGATYRGVGVPDCVSSGRRAARDALACMAAPVDEFATEQLTSTQESERKP